MKGTVLGVIFSTLLVASNSSAMSLTWGSFTGWGVNLHYGEPIGQSFTTTDADLGSIGFFLQAWGPSGADTSVTLSMYSGAGVTGSLLGSTTRTGLTTTGWVDFDISGISFDGGTVYSAVLTAADYYWAFSPYQHSTVDHYQDIAQDYTGGDWIFWGALEESSDSFFRIAPASAVPEPSSLLLLASGLLGLGLLRRRKHQP